jgi:hypothetical protein
MLGMTKAQVLFWQCGSCGWGFPGCWRSKCPACSAVGYWTHELRHDVQPWPGYQCATAPGVPGDPIPAGDTPQSLVEAAIDSLCALAGILVADAQASLLRAPAAPFPPSPALPASLPPSPILKKWQEQLKGEGYAVAVSGLWDEPTLAATEAFNRRQPPRCVDCHGPLARYAGPGADRGWCCVLCDDPFEGTSPGGEA